MYLFITLNSSKVFIGKEKNCLSSKIHKLFSTIFKSLGEKKFVKHLLKL